MDEPRPRPTFRLLIANRGEIAVRILQSVRELSPPQSVTYALYTSNDSTHISLGRPDRSIQVPSAASYIDISYLVALVKEHGIDMIHPGYGFLSESSDFARRMWTEANCVVIGPGPELLAETGDKLKAKALAQAFGVPVLQAMTTPTSSVAQVRQFACSVGFPIMVKAVDGGGGRGIRLVETDDLLQSAVERCVAESPLGTVFAERAAGKGYKHIEVQILGDGLGGAKHLWERDCSVQRRFQKIVEVAPAFIAQRKGAVTDAIKSAVMMAKKVSYLGLGTWEFLINIGKGKFFFVEINPRLQVEHTITEQVTGVDLVKEQLLIAQGFKGVSDVGLEWWEAEQRPLASSIQLRLCAEDPRANFAPSIGKVTDVDFPTGNGIRVDSHLQKGGLVGSDFDNMMAKIIVTAPTWNEAVRKAQRALADTKLVGVKTNLNLLRGILADKTFQAGAADTTWLERQMTQLVDSGDAIGGAVDAASVSFPPSSVASAQPLGVMSSGVLLRKGNAWSVALEQKGQKSNKSLIPHHLKLDRVTRNEFPQAFVADLSYTVPGEESVPYRVTMLSSTASADSTTSNHQRGDPNNKSHIVLPMSGKVMEMLVNKGDVVEENAVLAFVRQMKMELEVRSPIAGKIKWAFAIENDDGDDVAEGILLAELEDEQTPSTKVKSKI